jgi:hypothetical protein
MLSVGAHVFQIFFPCEFALSPWRLEQNGSAMPRIKGRDIAPEETVSHALCAFPRPAVCVQVVREKASRSDGYNARKPADPLIINLKSVNQSGQRGKSPYQCCHKLKTDPEYEQLEGTDAALKQETMD